MCMRRHFVVSLTSFQSAHRRAGCQGPDYLPHLDAAWLNTWNTHRSLYLHGRFSIDGGRHCCRVDQCANDGFLQETARSANPPRMTAIAAEPTSSVAVSGCSASFVVQWLINCPRQDQTLNAAVMTSRFSPGTGLSTGALST